jgi:hypothetical protein
VRAFSAAAVVTFRPNRITPPISPRRIRPEQAGARDGRAVHRHDQPLADELERFGLVALRTIGVGRGVAAAAGALTAGFAVAEAAPGPAGRSPRRRRRRPERREPRAGADAGSRPPRLHLDRAGLARPVARRRRRVSRGFGGGRQRGTVDDERQGDRRRRVGPQ